MASLHDISVTSEKDIPSDEIADYIMGKYAFVKSPTHNVERMKKELAMLEDAIGINEECENKLEKAREHLRKLLKVNVVNLLYLN